VGPKVRQESGFSRREDVYTFNLLKNKFYKCCAFIAICKDNAAINCITQHKKVHTNLVACVNNRVSKVCKITKNAVGKDIRFVGVYLST
jgi:hypothetical protein